MRKFAQLYQPVIFILLILTVSGCAQLPIDTLDLPHPLPIQDSPDPNIISTGDVLEIQYFFEENLTDNSYLLGVGDVININMYNHNELKQDNLTIISDGTISLPLIGAVKIVNLTLKQANDVLKEKFQEQGLKNPDVVIALVEWQQQLHSMLQSIRDSSNNGVLTRSIFKGISIDLPFIKPIAVDMPLEQIRANIKNQYLNKFGKLVSVVVNVSKAKTASVFVMGEVNHPGRVEISTSFTPLTAIAATGGMLETADSEAIKVIRYSSKDEYKQWSFDLTRDLNDPEAMHHRFKLQDHDIVLINRSGVADWNIWIDRYIRRMIPINMGAFLPIVN